MNLHAAARLVLEQTDADAKVASTQDLWRDWQTGAVVAASWPDASPLVDAGRPARPLLAPVDSMPRRELNGPQGHAALIHALTHIEFTAINLAVDAVYRFQSMPPAFHDDWLRVAAEEASHFELLRQHLRGLGHDYGDFPAHAGLWDMARRTAHDPLVRMALLPRYFEARGLDVTPGIQKKLVGYGDRRGAAILDIILRDEIGHVAAGDRWFRRLCTERGQEPEPTYRALLGWAGLPAPRRPFNEAARRQAGFAVDELDGC